jgi:hypothetical protein
MLRWQLLSSINHQRTQYSQVRHVSGLSLVARQILQTIQRKLKAIFDTNLLEQLR